MKYRFKTNIMCANCIAKVTPFLNANFEIEHWEVDIQVPGKILTVDTELSDEKVSKILKQAGYNIERLND